MNAPAAKSHADRRLRRAWRVLLALSLALVAVVAVSQYRHRGKITAYQQLQQSPAFRAAEARFLAEAQADELLGIQDADTGRRRTRRRDELAQSLFPGRTPTTLPGITGNRVEWEDPVRGLAFYFDFGTDGNLAGYSLGPLPAIPPREPSLLRAMRDVDPLRRMWVGSFTAWTVGPMLWVALILASILFKRWALPLAHAHLAVAWLCFLGWLLNPHYSISFRGIFSNDMLSWGTLMLITSGMVFGVTLAFRTAAGVDPSLCRACGYDLTGNISGVCPECGTPLAAAEHAPA